MRNERLSCTLLEALMYMTHSQYVPGLPLPEGEAGRRLGSQCRERIVADGGQLEGEGACNRVSFLCVVLPSGTSLREALVRGDPRETSRLSDVVRARVP